MLDKPKGLVPDSELDHNRSIFHGEVPSELNYHELAANKRHFLEAKDTPSLSISPEVMTHCRIVVMAITAVNLPLVHAVGPVNLTLPDLEDDN